MEDKKDAVEVIEEKIIVPQPEATTDLLDRQPFIDRVIKIIELQSAQKKTSCFAINGKWGVGKSFVLNMLEEQLEKIQSEETEADKLLAEPDTF